MVDLYQEILEQKLSQASQKYYEDGTSKYTDAEWDNMLEQLQQKNPDSPILKQIGHGYDVQKDTTKGEKIKHTYGTADSLTKCKSWDKKYPIPTEYKNIWIDMSIKLDGMTVCLDFKDGILTQARTRGDGIVGVDITEKVKHIIGDYRPIKDFTGGLRGEIIMTYDNFKLYRQNHIHDKNVPKNPRNSTVGLINGDNITEDYQYLTIVIYSVLNTSLIHPDIILDDMSNYNVLNNWMYTSVDSMDSKNLICVPREQLVLTEQNYLDALTGFKFDYEDILPMDGIVLTQLKYQYIDNNITMNQVAFKFPSEVKQVRVIDVEWNMSKTHYAIPRVQYEPVELAGTICEYATGYNALYIKDNHIGPDTMITIEKKGEIIPNIVTVIESCKSNLNTIPTQCPDCGGELIWNGVHLMCNNINCKNAEEQDVIVWLNNIAPVDNLGDKLRLKYLYQLFPANMNVDTIMSATINNLQGNTAHERLFTKMWNELHGDSYISLEAAIKALSVPRIGDKTACKLAQYPQVVQNLMNITDSNKIVIPTEIGDANTQTIIEHIDKFKRLQYIQHRIVWEVNVITETTKVAVTGKLSVKRSDFENELKEYGYQISDIAKDTKFLITDNPNSSSSKNRKADDWGIKKITEQVFRANYLIK